MTAAADIATAHKMIEDDIAALEAMIRRHMSGQATMPVASADDALQDLCAHLEDGLEKMLEAFSILDEALTAAEDHEIGADNRPETYVGV
jgi:hypothetical protein